MCAIKLANDFKKLLFTFVLRQIDIQNKATETNDLTFVT